VRIGDLRRNRAGRKCGAGDQRGCDSAYGRHGLSFDRGRHRVRGQSSMCMSAATSEFHSLGEVVPESRGSRLALPRRQNSASADTAKRLERGLEGLSILAISAHPPSEGPRASPSRDRRHRWERQRTAHSLSQPAEPVPVPWVLTPARDPANASHSLP
jgi:hypothetical protein